jgi:hypothetical protein
MNRALRLIGLFVCSFVIAATAPIAQQVSAPELFGRANMVELLIDVHVIFNDDIGYLVLGQSEGSIQQLWGTSVDGAEQPISFMLAPRGQKFTGSILFRGHDRPFCGADLLGNFPRACRLS